MKLKRLQHAMYLCRDLEASRKFYTDVLGMEEIPRKLIDPVRKGAWFKLGDTRFHLAQWEEGHWSLGGATQPITVWDNHLAFEVDDIEAWKRRLTEMGIEYMVGTMGEGFMKQIYFRDPGGNCGTRAAPAGRLVERTLVRSCPVPCSWSQVLGEDGKT